MSDKLFEALLAQMRDDGRINAGEIGAVVPMDEAGLNFGRWCGEENEEDEVSYYDDLSGERLDSNMVRQARGEEMVEVKKHDL